MSHDDRDRSVTARPETRGGSRGTFWRYRDGVEPAFDPVVFDEHALARRGARLGRALAGRGNTHFFRLDGHDLVLRHYRRGGLIRHVSERRYVWTGLARTRAVREFELLRELERHGLPVPVPFACAVTRHGSFRWSGSLVTRRLPGRTLAEWLARRHDAPWQAIGRCIARFHRAGCQHADLNAHNIMIDGDTVFLIDFDRAVRRAPGAATDTGTGTVGTRWQWRNLARLRRSLTRLAARRGEAFDEHGFALLEQAWRAAMIVPMPAQSRSPMRRST